MNNLKLNVKDKKSLFLLELSIISFLVQTVTFLLSKLIYILAEPDVVYSTLGEKWIESLPSITKLATFFPGIIGIVLLILSICIFIKDKNNN